jgi:hypothetical protein
MGGPEKTGFPLPALEGDVSWERAENRLEDLLENHASELLKKAVLSGCSKRLRYKAPEILRSEAYM